MAYNKSDWSRKNRKENDKHHRNDWRKEFKLGEIVNIRGQQMEVIMNDFTGKLVLDNDFGQVSCDQIEERTCRVCGGKYQYPKDDGSDLGCCCDACEEDWILFETD
jgi:hypothetical protein